MTNKISSIINGTRLFERLMELAKIGKKGDTGVERLVLSSEDDKAQELVTSWMEEAGMSVRVDHFGNLIGRKEGRDKNLPTVMIGSHIDTVPNGGRFDGTIGVLGGIEVVQTLKEANVVHDNPIEVVAFCDEEGTRFADGFFGSRGMIGHVESKDLEAKDENGLSREEALASFREGIDVQRRDESIRKPDDVKLFLEMHIEQGPFLEKRDLPVGIVEGIAGPVWGKVQKIGEAGHAGTVPMNMRRDPLAGAAEVIASIEAICKQDTTGTLVGTVGKIEAHPGGRNVIPDSVEFSLDLRDVDLQKRENALNRIEESIASICKDRGLTGILERTLSIDPVLCSGQIIESLQEGSSSLGLEAPLMISGAGHDAMFMEKITRMGMVFVRCKNGISHNPAEWAEKEDIVAGTALLYEVIRRNI
ncbi:Zn-dependent hydrolase [Bacillus piscicola]|uniref:Zn-dependent hydrolase n=1 Tax=Bacillus piscicola TaxID=1632684 RepID=UPI001F0890E5|nr:Zn-dependent hydrolase [Bacillus piscicola]